VDGFSTRSGLLSLAGARRLSFQHLRPVQTYALTVLFGVVLMGLWLLTRQTVSLPTF